MLELWALFSSLSLSFSLTHTHTHPNRRAVSLTHAQVFPKNFITKGSHMHWNTASKQGSCSWILNFPCLLCNRNCLSFLSAAPSVRAPNKTYGNMKGGARPSLSSRDRLPGLAMATSGLCYILHKSSSCFTNALPHLGAGLICQVELPGKFFPFSKPYCRLPPVHFLLLVLWLLWCPLMLLTVRARCHDEFKLCYWLCHCLHPSILTFVRPHQKDGCLSKQNGCLALSWWWRVFIQQKPLTHSRSCSQTLTGSLKPWGNWVTEEWETRWWHVGI